MIRLAEKYADRPPAELPLLFQRILSNATMDWFRRQKVRNAVMHEPLGLRIGAAKTATSTCWRPWRRWRTRLGAESAADSVSRAQILRVIDGEVAELPARQREAFLLRYWEELDVAETAAVMGCSEGSVKTHCSRAVHAWRRPCKPRESRHEQPSNRSRLAAASRRLRGALCAARRGAADLTRSAGPAARCRRAPALRPRTGAGARPRRVGWPPRPPPVVVGVPPAALRSLGSVGAVVAALAALLPLVVLVAGLVAIDQCTTRRQIASGRRDRRRAAGRRPAAGRLQRSRASPSSCSYAAAD